MKIDWRLWLKKIPWQVPVLGLGFLLFGVSLGIWGAKYVERDRVVLDTQSGETEPMPYRPPKVQNLPPPTPLAIPNTHGTLPANYEDEFIPEEEHKEAATPSYTPPPVSDNAASFVPLPPKEGVQNWAKYAVAFHMPAPSKPLVVVVIDDLGVDKRKTQRMIELPGPLTLSFIPYANDLAAQTGTARAMGHELMLHMPMQPLDPKFDPGPGALFTTLSEEEIRNRLKLSLARFSGYVGINNHMGSRFTADKTGMAVVMDELRERGLLFLDSKTSGNSVGIEVARKYGVPSTERHIFLDSEPNNQAIVRQRLHELERIARQQGYAIAIGHPHDTTTNELEHWLPTLAAKGIVLAPISAIIKSRHTRTASRNGNAHE